MKKTSKILVAALSLVLIIAGVTGCGSSKTPGTDTSTGQPVATGNARSLEDIKNSGKITIGVFSDKRPFGFVDENGAYKGYDVTYAERIAKDLGVEVEFVSLEAASRVEYLQSGKVDIVLANFTVTDERKEVVDFVLPYMKVALGVVSPDAKLITKPEELNGKTLIVSKGTTAEVYFAANYPEVKLLKFDQYTEAFNALLDGRGDALSTDNTEVLAWALSNQGFTVGIESLGNTDTIAAAVQKGNNELKDWLDEHIKELAKEDFFHANYKENLEPVYGNTVDPDNIVVEGGIVQ